MIRKKIEIKKSDTASASYIKNYGGDNGSSSYALTDHYLVKNGKPWFPVMGEFHFSRYPAEFWDESLQKIKAGGVDIISTYVFWIHHEEEERKFDWSGNKDLRRFIELCGKNDLEVCLRIGPWSHGECRNGGFPDWLLKKGIKLRENDEKYFAYVKRFYSQIFSQVKGLLFYDKGPISMVQIENEYGHCGGLQGEAGIKHIMALKKLAVGIGFDVPFYTTTGWGNGVVVEGETLPVLGAYAEAPWEQHINERRAASEFLFSPIKRETNVGTDLSCPMLSSFSYDLKKFPYLMAELGSGHEPTHHRRPIISGDDTGALAHAFLGSGANLLGYYMYHGGTNPLGRFSTLQESKATGYLNDVPELSYDFQAPIGEYGFLSDAYGRLKACHLFLHDFGEEMARSSCILPQDNPKDAEDKENLRYCVRYGDKGGFLFLSNYQRRRNLTAKENVNVLIETEDGSYSFEGINLPDKKYIFYPFDLKIDGVEVVTATAQPLCRIENDGVQTIFFFCYEGDSPEFRLKADGIKSLDAKNKCFDRVSGTYRIKLESGALHSGFSVKTLSGDAVRVSVLTRQEAYGAYKIERGHNQYLVITDACLYGYGGAYKLVSDKKKTGIRTYPQLTAGTLSGAKLLKESESAGFYEYSLIYDGVSKKPQAKARELSKKNNMASYSLTVKRSQGENVDDDILTLPFEGDRARLYIDGKLSADWFYNGTNWTIGLKRFKDIENKSIRLDIEGLSEDDFVFLEKKPEFIDGAACSLLDAKIKTVYFCTFF